MMTLSESLGQKCHPVSHAAPLKRNTPTPFTFLSLSPRQTGVVEKKNGWAAILSVPSRLSLLLSSCLLHASRGQNVPSSSKNDPICAMSVGSVKVLCVFFLSLVQTRSHLCHIGSVCSSHLVCSTHLEAWRPRERTNQFFPCRFNQSVVCVSLNPQASTNSSMPCRFNVLLPSCLLHASRGQAWRPRARTNQSLRCLFSQSVVSVVLNPWASKIPSVPCRFSVFFPPCLLHASRGQTWHPRASTTHSLPCRFSRSLL